MEAARIALVLPRGAQGAAVRLASAVARLAQRGWRRFEIHVYTDEEKPLYIEGLREFIQSNIAYTITIYSHGLAETRGGLGEIDALIAPRGFLEKHAPRGDVLVVEIEY